LAVLIWRRQPWPNLKTRHGGASA